MLKRFEKANCESCCGVLQSSKLPPARKSGLGSSVSSPAGSGAELRQPGKGTMRNYGMRNIDAECIKCQKRQHISTKPNYNPDLKASSIPHLNHNS